MTTTHPPATAPAPAHSARAPRRAPAPPTPPRDPADPDPRWADRWPLRSYLELAALDTAPGVARAHATALLWEWHLAGITDEAALIVSELVTNAVFATRRARLPAPVRLWTLGTPAARALFLIWDATRPPPVRQDPAPDAEHGRGLTLVNALSATWGHYHPAGPPHGKITWAALEAPAPPRDRAARYMP